MPSIGRRRFIVWPLLAMVISLPRQEPVSRALAIGGLRWGTVAGVGVDTFAGLLLLSCQGYPKGVGILTGKEPGEGSEGSTYEALS